MSSEGHKLGKVCTEALQIMRIHPGKLEGRAMRSFDPQTLLLLETAFDEAWLTLKSFGNNTVKPDELARAVFRLAMEDERHPVRLHDGALERLLPATTLARGELIAQQCRPRYSAPSSSAKMRREGLPAISPNYRTCHAKPAPPHGTRIGCAQCERDRHNSGGADSYRSPGRWPC